MSQGRVPASRTALASPARPGGPGPAGPPLRILMVAASPFPLPQGSQVLIAGLAEALKQRGHQICIVAYPTGRDSPRLSVPVQRTRAFFYRRLNPGPSLSKPLVDLLLARRVLALARRQRPDLLHAHNFEGLLVALWVRRRTGTRVVYHLHNLMEPELPAYFRFSPLAWLARHVGRWVDQTLPRRADACILLSPETLTRLASLRLPAGRVHLVPPGVDLPRQFSDPAAVRRLWGLGPGPLVLYSGNFDRYQDLDFLLRAFRHVHGACPDARLVLVTHGGVETRRRQAIRQVGGPAVQLLSVTGWEEMVDLLASCDLAVSPRQECWGFPIKVLNYMAAGRPVVAAAGSAQGLRHMETAWVVPNGDEEAFAQAVITLLHDRDLATRLGRAARREAEERFSWPACAQAVEQVYRKVLALAGPPACESQHQGGRDASLFPISQD